MLSLKYAAAASALGFALCLAAPASAASISAPAPARETAARIVASDTPAAFTRARGFRRGGFAGRRGFGSRRGFYGRPYGHRRGFYGRRSGYGPAVGLGIAGLATGALIGSTLAAPAQTSAAFAPNPDYVAYCARKYRSFDAATGTYLGNDGVRHVCQ